jgi:hypothetical protein
VSYWQQGKHWLFRRLAEAGRDESAHHVCPALKATNWHADHLAVVWAGFSGVGNCLLFVCLMSARTAIEQISAESDATTDMAADAIVNFTKGF